MQRRTSRSGKMETGFTARLRATCTQHTTLLNTLSETFRVPPRGRRQRCVLGVTTPSYYIGQRLWHHRPRQHPHGDAVVRVSSVSGFILRSGQAGGDASRTAERAAGENDSRLHSRLGVSAGGSVACRCLGLLLHRYPSGEDALPCSSRCGRRSTGIAAVLDLDLDLATAILVLYMYSKTLTCAAPASSIDHTS